MKKIYIGFASGNVPVGLVLAETKDIAWAFFTGRGDNVTSIEEIDLSDDIITSQPLVVLMTSKKLFEYNFRDRVDYREWKRGQ